MKVVAYIRVSSLEQKEQGYSPDAQKRLLWGFARDNGYEVVHTFEEAETAKRAGRKEFQKMLRMVEESDNIKAILVEKTDRLQRNFKDFVVINELVESKDIKVFLVKENDVIAKNAPSHKKLMQGIKVVMAKNFIDNLSEETKKGQIEKMERGEYPGKAPLGYVNAANSQTKRRIIKIDQSTEKLVKKHFTLYSSGKYSIDSLITKLNEDGDTLCLPPGKKLHKSTTDKLLRSPFYYGEFYWSGKRCKGTHEPLISFELWNRVQCVLTKRGCATRYVSNTYNSISFAFKNIFTCGECGRMVTAERKKGKYVYYRCTRYKKLCSQRPIKEEIVAASFEKLIENFDYPDEMIKFVSEGLKQSLQDKRGMEENVYKNFSNKKEKLRKRLDALYEDKLDGKISEERYQNLFDRYSEELDLIDRKLVGFSRAEINYYDFGKRTLELAKNASKLYKQGTDQEKHQIASFLLSNSQIRDGKPEFELKKPFSTILKHSPLRECSTWGGQRESNPY